MLIIDRLASGNFIGKMKYGNRGHNIPFILLKQILKKEEHITSKSKIQSMILFMIIRKQMISKNYL